MATAAEIVELDVNELETRLTETRRELFNLRFQLATGQLDNFSRMSHVRKDIARLMTELRAREIAEAEGLAVEDIPVHQAVARQQAEDKKLGRTRIPAAERRAAERAEENQDAEAEGPGAGAKTEDEVEDEAASTTTVTAAASEPSESGDAAESADEDVNDVEEEG